MLWNINTLLGFVNLSFELYKYCIQNYVFLRFKSSKIDYLSSIFLMVVIGLPSFFSNTISCSVGTTADHLRVLFNLNSRTRCLPMLNRLLSFLNSFSYLTLERCYLQSYYFVYLSFGISIKHLFLDLFLWRGILRGKCFLYAIYLNNL